MKVFLAGTSVSNPEDEKKIQNLFKRGNKLHSYFHIVNLEKKWWNMNKENNVNIFLDSGAFSAWTQGTNINIDEYIDFIKQNEKNIKIYANLDVISIDGKRPNEETAKKTLENQKIMEKAGLNPLPCFHIGEPFKYLEYYVDNYEYLALGVAGVKGASLIPWLDECFSKYICDKRGYPKIKIHGFAITSVTIMIKYPWYSVDSTSWVVTGRHGGVFIPPYKNGKYLYDITPIKIMVSNRNPGIKEKGVHINNVRPAYRNIYLEYFKEKGYVLGKSEMRKVKQDYQLQDDEKWAESKLNSKKEERLVEKIIQPGLSNTYQLRDELNILYFLDLEKNSAPWPQPFRKEVTNGFFE